MARKRGAAFKMARRRQTPAPANPESAIIKDPAERAFIESTVREVALLESERKEQRSGSGR